MAEAAQKPDLKKTAIETVRQILKVYDLWDEADVPCGEEYDYQIGVVEDDDVLTVDITANPEESRILVGKESANLRALQKLLTSALHYRLGDGEGERFERYVRFSVNGQYARREKGGGERADGKRQIKIIVPPGIEVRVVNE